MRTRSHLAKLVLAVGATLGTAVAAQPATAWAQQPADRTRDRGAGIPVSMFGSYIEPGEFLLYPFVEYYWDNDSEYSPQELGFGLDQDFFGKYTALEGLIFLAYGVSDRLALELEAAVITARLEKAPEDPSAMPARIEESGLGDVETSLRWRWAAETPNRPEIFSFFETVFPLQRTRRIIGTQDWEFVLGSGVVRGFSWGTMTLRLEAEYDAAERVFDAGEYAIEYLKRISPALRVYLAVEGTQDEVELIPELQWFLRPNVFLKLNSAVGLTRKADDWAPEVGLMFSFR